MHKNAIGQFDICIRPAEQPLCVCDATDYLGCSSNSSRLSMNQYGRSCQSFRCLSLCKRILLKNHAAPLFVTKINRIWPWTNQKISFKVSPTKLLQTEMRVIVTFNPRSASYLLHWFKAEDTGVRKGREHFKGSFQLHLWGRV